MPDGTSLPRRRNGYIAACEPCRKSKAKCDHTHPICSRCRKRRAPADCVFLTAPMTQARSPGRSSAPISPPLTQHSSPACRVEHSLDLSDQPSSVSDTQGYLGSTSFSATIDHRNLPEEAAESQSKNDSKGPVDPNHLQLGLKVLKQLPSEPACHTLLEWYNSTTEAGYESKQSLRDCVIALWSTFGNELRSPEVVALAIFYNGSQSVRLDDQEREWMEPFSGSKTRRETLGVLFGIFTFALLSLPDENISACFSRQSHDRQNLIKEMKICVEACINLCRGSLNSIVCHVLYKNMLLEAILHGDASLSVWRLHNDLIGTAVALGLHVYQGPSKITIASEMTKRLSGCIFWSDKELSMFTGRPPSLSRRYYSCPPPADVSEHALLAGGEVLEKELSSLDENGWNTSGGMYRSTHSRMLVIHGKIQDEVMELFIGTQDQWSSDRLNDLRQRTQEVYAQFPIQLQISKQDIMACPDEKTMWRLLCGRLEYLRIQFLLERLAAEREGASKRELLAVAQESLNLIVFLWVERERSLKTQHHYDYIIMCNGMPSIGILCTELLRQVKHPEQAEVKLPVSEIVHNLSLMISFLEWIRPTAGNYKLCRPFSRVIRRVLDQLFEPAAPTAVALPQNRDGMLQIAPDESGWPLDSMDDLEWLNSIDWTLGQYIDFN